MSLRGRIGAIERELGRPGCPACGMSPQTAGLAVVLDGEEERTCSACGAALDHLGRSAGKVLLVAVLPPELVEL